MATVTVITNKKGILVCEVVKLNSKTVIVQTTKRHAGSFITTIIKRHIKKHSVCPRDFSWWPR